MKLTTTNTNGQMEAGVYENVRIIEASTARSANVNLPILVLTFLLEDGRKVTHSEYMPIARRDEATEKLNERKQGLLTARYPSFLKYQGITLDVEIDENLPEDIQYEQLFGAIAKAINTNKEAANVPITVQFREWNGYLQLPTGKNAGLNKFMGYPNETKAMRAVADLKEQSTIKDAATKEAVKIEDDMPF